MDMIIQKLAEELGQKTEYISNVVTLLDEGNTIPFIARYRKEMHGAMDDTVLRNLETRLQYLRNLEERKEEVIKSIASQEKLTEELFCGSPAATADPLIFKEQPPHCLRADIDRAMALFDAAQDDAAAMRALYETVAEYKKEEA